MTFLHKHLAQQYSLKVVPTSLKELLISVYIKNTSVSIRLDIYFMAFPPAWGGSASSKKNWMRK